MRVPHLVFWSGAPWVWVESAAGPLPVGRDLPEPLVLWLPTAGRRMLPSPAARRRGVNPPRDPTVLARWEAGARRLPWRALWRCPGRGEEWEAWRMLARLAWQLWGAGRVLPALVEGEGCLHPRWQGVPGDPVAFARWARRLPRALFAAAAPGTDLALLGRELLDRVVDEWGAAVGTPGESGSRRWVTRAQAAAGFPVALAAAGRPEVAPTRAALALAQALRDWRLAAEGDTGGEPRLLARFDPGSDEMGRLTLRVQEPGGAAAGSSWEAAVGAGRVAPDAFAAVLDGPGPVLSRLRREAPTDRLTLEGEELRSFLTEEASRLVRQGARVLWPRECVRRPQVTVRARLGGAGMAAFGLDTLCRVDWEVVLAGCRMSPQELARQVRRRQPWVELLGRYVLLTAQEVRRAGWLLGQGPELSLRTLLEHAGDSPEGAWRLELEGEGALAGLLAPAWGQPARVPTVPVPEAVRSALRAYQEAGFRWLAALAEAGLGALLADDMGLGKTLQVIALLLHRRGRGTSLVVAPTSVLTGWLRECERWAPELAVRLFHGPARSLPEGGADVVLTSYGMLARREELTRPAWDLVVLDEAQQVKNPLTAASRAARSLRAAARVALTGTPVENRLLDLWSIFAFLNPGYLGSRRAFSRRFAGPVEREEDAAAASALRRRVAPFLLRRTKDDPTVAPELPPRVERVEYPPLTAEQAALYRAVVEQLERDWRTVADPNLRRGLILAALTRLKLILDHPALYLKEDGRLRPERSGKCVRLLELLEEALGAGERVLIYSQFAQFARRLAHLVAATQGVPTAVLWGGQTRAQRDAAVAVLRRAAGPAVLVLSLRAGGVGLNLQEATRVVHMDRWWNPAVEDQATDRAHRIGQRRTVTVHALVAAGTYEERVHELLERKRRLAGRVVGSEAQLLAALSGDELRDVLRLREVGLG